MRLGITIGDIGGIGPEVLMKAFAEQSLRDRCTPIVYASARALDAHRDALGMDAFKYSVVGDIAQAKPGRINVIECINTPDKIAIGAASAEGGKAALQSLDAAIADAKAGHLDAMLTLPLDKSTVAAHAPGFRGHTEHLAAAFGVKENLMLLMDSTLRVGLVTNHVPVRDIAGKITTALITKKLAMMHETLRRDFSFTKPQIAVLGLNPHAGDDGLIGTEEKDIILPALQQASEAGMFVQGPFPADGFFASGNFRKYDAILAMYHDQGLVPFKYISGYGGVNYTAGMPFIRTSPDHGTAYDIAGMGKANPDSVRQAFYAALDIWRARAENDALRENPLKFRPMSRER